MSRRSKLAPPLMFGETVTVKQQFSPTTDSQWRISVKDAFELRLITAPTSASYGYERSYELTFLTTCCQYPLKTEKGYAGREPVLKCCYCQQPYSGLSEPALLSVRWAATKVALKGGALSQYVSPYSGLSTPATALLCWPTGFPWTLLKKYFEPAKLKRILLKLMRT